MGFVVIDNDELVPPSSRTEALDRDRARVLRQDRQLRTMSALDRSRRSVHPTLLSYS